MFKKMNSKGFTLIELMIVVAIIGILAAIAIPSFMTYQCKSKQTEAKQALGQIAKLEVAFQVEHDTYTDSKGAIGFTISTGNPRYAYALTASATTFTATATGNAGTGVDADEWTMTQDQTLTNSVNTCQ